MRNVLLVSFSAFLFVLASCTKNPAEPVVVDPAMVPPLKELRYTNNGAYFFGFGMSGVFKFSTDVSGGQFKVIITKVESFGSSSYTTTATYKYDRDNKLIELERVQPSVNERVYLKFYYTGSQLTRFEEWNKNTKIRTFNVKHEVLSSGRKLTIEPYVASNGSAMDTLTHSMWFNDQGKVVKYYQRARNNPPFPGMSTETFNVNYNGNDVSSTNGYMTYKDFNTTEDSTVLTQSYTRMLNENPVLVNYLSSLYGSDFYAILTYFNRLNMEKFSNSVGADIFRLSSQNKSSLISSKYTGKLYQHNIYSSDVGNSNLPLQNILDGMGRLIKSTRSPSSSGNYNSWEIVYE